MGEQGYIDELERALARPDADEMCRRLDACFIDCQKSDSSDDATDEIITCYLNDPEKAFAYVILAAARSDDQKLLGWLASGPLEDVLRSPSDELLQRIIDEARKSARLRWMLGFPFKVAMAARAWDAIEKFRMDGSVEEFPARLCTPR